MIPRVVNMVGREGIYKVKDGRRMTDEEAALEGLAPRLRVHLKDCFDAGLTWQDAISSARAGCVAEKESLEGTVKGMGLSKAARKTADLPRLLDLLEREAKADWERWVKLRDA